MMFAEKRCKLALRQSFGLVLYCRSVVEEDLIKVYHSLENSRTYHETDPQSLELGLEVKFINKIGQQFKHKPFVHLLVIPL